MYRSLFHAVLGIAIVAAPLTGQSLPDECTPDSVAVLDVVHPWRATMEVRPGPQGPDAQVRCLEVVLTAGEFLRAVAEMEVDPPLSGLQILLYPPGAESPESEVQLGNVARRSVTLQARQTGPHHIVVRNAWTVSSEVSSVPVRIWVEQVEPPALAVARREAVATDARVEWLRQNVIRVRSIDPGDEDFTDLEPLGELLDGVRIVLLGEADHRSGSDFLAKSRLVKFLHREHGFDVLAFESPMYDMAVAWDRMQAGMEPREAFALGSLHLWGGVAEMQPLVTYLGNQVDGTRPLEIVGFDNQPQQASVRFFMDDLAEFFLERGVGGPLVSAGTEEYMALEALAQVLYRTGRALRPDVATRRALLIALDEAVAAVGAMEDKDALWWTQILRGMRCHAQRVLTHDEIGYCNRNDQMAENLLWLAKERYPTRSIIVWSGTAHAARMPEIHPAGGTGPSLGYRIGETFGTESYVIGVTSYRSAARHISPYQHPLPEFEELMAVAEFDYGFLNLRRSDGTANWTAGEFRSRPFGHVAESAIWSDLLDGFLFVREHSLSQPVR
jgi:erythromycin esterase